MSNTLTPMSKLSPSKTTKACDTGFPHSNLQLSLELFPWSACSSSLLATSPHPELCLWLPDSNNASHVVGISSGLCSLDLALDVMKLSPWLDSALWCSFDCFIYQFCHPTEAVHSCGGRQRASGSSRNPRCVPGKTGHSATKLTCAWMWFLV